MDVGDLVVFDDKVYGPAYAPYYDEYKGRKFIVTRRAANNHIYVAPINEGTMMEFMCHDDELVLLGE